jgi:hypothetical protein
VAVLCENGKVPSFPKREILRLDKQTRAALLYSTERIITCHGPQFSSWIGFLGRKKTGKIVIVTGTDSEGDVIIVFIGKNSSLLNRFVEVAHSY